MTNPHRGTSFDEYLQSDLAMYALVLDGVVMRHVEVEPKVTYTNGAGMAVATRVLRDLIADLRQDLERFTDPTDQSYINAFIDKVENFAHARSISLTENQFAGEGDDLDIKTVSEK